jgi:hypothetical protein
MRWNHLPLTMNLDGVSTPKVDDELSVLGFGDVDKDEDSIIIPIPYSM